LVEKNTVLACSPTKGFQMKLNSKVKAPAVYTAEGAKAIRIDSYSELRRSVMSCMLWEDGFYESGKTIGDRIAELVAKVDSKKVAALAVEARDKMKLRHVPLLLVAELAKKAGGTSLVSDTLEQVIQRADEPAEFLKIYWRNGVTPIANQIKKGLARALRKFNGYQLAKYNRDGDIKLRDVLFLTHAKPSDKQTGNGEAELADAVRKKDYKRGEVMRHKDSLFAKLVDGTLEAPDTWEVALSAGKDKKATFERLISEDNLGYLALLRNLRNMEEAGCDRGLVSKAISARKGANVVLPFRYVAASRAAPMYAPVLDKALLESIKEMDALPGVTLVLVDVSGSMDVRLSAKSDLSRFDAAATLASVIPGDVRMLSFSNRLVEVPAYRGMAGVEVLNKSQPHSGTELYRAVELANKIPHDRIIVITDEQAAAGVRVNPVVDKAYMINVASYRNGVGYGKWIHLDGFSENVLRWIAEYERGAK
jgi:hypothetical protein